MRFPERFSTSSRHVLVRRFCALALALSSPPYPRSIRAADTMAAQAPQFQASFAKPEKELAWETLEYTVPELVRAGDSVQVRWAVLVARRKFVKVVGCVSVLAHTSRVQLATHMLTCTYQGIHVHVNVYQ